MDFVKLYSGFFTGSMRDEAPYTRLVFLAMLLISDKTGLVEGSASFIASYANLPLADVNEALERLMSPDPNSTTPDCDGARIVKDGNNRWRIVNFTKYYEMDRHKERAEYMRGLMRKRRSSSDSGSNDDEDDENVSTMLADVSNVLAPVSNVLADVSRPLADVSSVSQMLADVSSVSRKKKRKEKKYKEDIYMRSDLESEDDCIEYAKHLSLPPEEGSKFWAYHESTGWVYGPSKKPIVNRKAAMATWKTNYLKYGGKLVEKTCTLEDAIKAVSG